jgi:hypothetical protein
MFSFQPAAYIGNEARWEDGFRAVDADAVWQRIEQAVGRPLPTRVLQVGDLRCNRVCWGAYVGERYVPVFEEGDRRDERARDALLAIVPGGLLAERSVAVNVVRVARLLVRRPALAATTLAWVARFVRRAGGFSALRRGVHPVTFVVHSFIDAAVVAPAWELLQRAGRTEDSAVTAAAERLAACSYLMAHPESGQLVPACVQHAVLDPAENVELAQRLAAPRRRTAR